MASTDDRTTPTPTAAAPAAADRVSLQPLPAPKPPVAPERVARRRRALDGVLVALVLLFAFECALFPAANSDFFMHAAVGRAISTGVPLSVDPFAFTTAGVYWVNHNWLYDLAVWAIYSIPEVGGVLLVVLKALAIAALAELMLRSARPPGRSLWIPAACVGLAILVLSARVFLQPVCVSYLFLGLTFWLLRRPRLFDKRTAGVPGRRAEAPARPLWSLWLLPPLFALWVNLDGWFLLGPAVVALYLLGEALQVWIVPGDDGPAPGELRTLTLALVVGVAACLLNPFHYHAFVLPAQLGFTEAGELLRDDIQFKTTFLSPFDNDPNLGYTYLHSNVGLSVAGVAYFPLALFGAASFGLSLWAGKLNLSRLLVWASFFALSALHMRAIPFFAVIGGPIMALNFLDFAAARSGTAATRGGAARWAVGGRLLTAFAVVVLLVVGWTGWLQARPQEQRRVGWTVEPDASLRAAAQQIAAWRRDGLLQGDVHWFNDSPEVLNYMAWYCPGERGFFDQRLALYDRNVVAEYLQVRKSLDSHQEKEAGWRKVFRPHDVRFLFHFDIDPQRTSSPIRRLFEGGKEWPLAFQSGRALIFGWRADPAKAGKPDDPFLAPEINDEVKAFGPEAVRAPEPPARAPQPRQWWTILWSAPPLRPPEAYDAAVHLTRFDSQRPAYAARNRVLWDDRWSRRREAMTDPSPTTVLRDTTPTALASLVGTAGGPFGADSILPFGIRLLIVGALPKNLPPQWEGGPKTNEEKLGYQLLQPNDFSFDAAPPAELHLAIRAARRALVADPDDPATHLRLAQAYMLLLQETREGPASESSVLAKQVRFAQAAAALRHALDPNFTLPYPLSLQARQVAYVLFKEQGFKDVAVAHLKEKLRILKEESRSPEEPPAQFQERMSKFSQDLTAIEDNLKQDLDKFELRSSGKSTLEKAQLAMEYGLSEQALELLLHAPPKDLNDASGRPVGLLLEYTLLLQIGRVEEAAEALSDKEKELRSQFELLPEQRLPTYPWLKTLAAAATGDYAEADRRLEEMQKELSKNYRLAAMLRELMQENDKSDVAQELNVPTASALLVGWLVLREAPNAAGMPWQLYNQVPLKLTPQARPLPATREILLALSSSELTATMGQEADATTVRGWLALEAGDVKAARGHFEKALALGWPPRRWLPLFSPLAAGNAWDAAALAAVAQASASSDVLQFHARPLALLSLEWMDAAPAPR
jgi:hypothetical protein